MSLSREKPTPKTKPKAEPKAKPKSKAKAMTEATATARNVVKKAPAPRRGRTTFLDAQTTRGRGKATPQFSKGLWMTVLSVIAVGLFGWILIKGIQTVARGMYLNNDRYQLVDSQHRFHNASGGILQFKQTLQIANIDQEGNLFDFDIQKSRKKLLDMPAIKDAQIKRILPGGLDIRVDERLPIARLKIKNLLVDEQGLIVRSAITASDRKLPVISGYDSPAFRAGSDIKDTLAEDALNVLNTIQRSPFLPRYIKVKQLDVSDVEFLTVRLDDDRTLLLPRHRFDVYLTRAAHFLDEITAGRTVTQLDFTSNGQMVVR